MFQSPDRFERFQRYLDELGKLCDQVDRELNANRRKRSDWFDTTRKWKEEWLTHHEEKISISADVESVKKKGSQNKRS